MGTVNPLGKNLEEYWHGLIEGRRHGSPGGGLLHRELTRNSLRGAQLRPQEFMDRNVHSAWRGFPQMAVAAVDDGAGRLGLDLAKGGQLPRRVDMGTGIGGFIEMTNGAISYATKGGSIRLRADDHPQHGRCVGAMAFHLRGPNTTVTTAWRSLDSHDRRRDANPSTRRCGCHARRRQRGIAVASGDSAFNAIRALSTRTKRQKRQVVPSTATGTGSCRARVPASWCLSQSSTPRIAALASTARSRLRADVRCLSPGRAG